MLLGGAVALALSGAAYAQAQQTSPQATPGTDQINAGSAAGTQTTTGNTPSATTKTVRHVHHVVHHHRVHVKTAMIRRRHGGTRTASALHGPSTPAERAATRSLNEQQLQGGAMMNTGNMAPAGGQPAPGTPAGYSAPQTGPQPGPQAPPPGSENNNMPSNTNYSAPPGSENAPPSNATYSQPQGSPGVQPGNAGYQQPTAPAATPPPPPPPADQNVTPPPPPANNNPSQPGPSS